MHILERPYFGGAAGLSAGNRELYFVACLMGDVFLGVPVVPPLRVRIILYLVHDCKKYIEKSLDPQNATHSFYHRV